jgi:hypothetical protein
LQFLIFNFQFLIKRSEATFLGEPLRFARVGLSAPSPPRLRARTRGARRPHALRWFRFYPSRFAAFGGIKIIYNPI